MCVEAAWNIDTINFSGFTDSLQYQYSLYTVVVYDVMYTHGLDMGYHIVEKDKIKNWLQLLAIIALIRD